MCSSDLFDSLTNAIVWRISRSKAKRGHVYSSNIYAHATNAMNDTIFSANLKHAHYPWGGHYCSFCSLANRKRYNNLDSLLDDHIILPTLGFLKLVSNNRYIQFSCRDDSCMTRLVYEKKLTMKHAASIHILLYVNRPFKHKKQVDHARQHFHSLDFHYGKHYPLRVYLITIFFRRRYESSRSQ